MFRLINKYFSYCRGYITSLLYFENPVFISQAGRISIYCHNGSITVGKKTRYWPNVKLSCEGTPSRRAVMKIGKAVQIGDNTQLHCALHLIIEDEVMISWGCSIMDRDFHGQNGCEEKIAPTIIGKKVWIGCNSIILRGVHIGEGAVVGAGSVVTKDVPAFSTVAGNPAREISNQVKLI